MGEGLGFIELAARHVVRCRMRPTFDRAGLACYVDRVRAFLVPATPEEAVRQDALDWLIDQLGVPPAQVRSEFSMAKRARGRGRADILVLSPGSSDHDGDVLMVVECKRPGVFIDDATFEQARGYAESVGATHVVLTNGGSPRTYARDGARWRELRETPSWAALLAGRRRRWAPAPVVVPPRWDQIATAEGCFAVAHAEPLYDGILGEDSPDELAPFVFNLFGFLAFGTFEVPTEDDAIVIEQDLGRRSRFFGHHLGDGWRSDGYRSLLVRDRRTRSHQVVSLTLSGGMKSEDHPVYGNRIGRTYLCAAVDHERASRMSLEMALDGFADQVDEGAVDLRHNGRLTAGRRGAVALKTVRDFVRSHASNLVVGEEIRLGTLPTDRAITWADGQDFVLRVIRYVIERDRLREELSRTAPAKPVQPRVTAAERYAATLAEANLTIGQLVQALWEGELYDAEVLAPGARRGVSGEVFIDAPSVQSIGRGLIRVGWRGEGLYSDLSPAEIPRRA